MKKSVLILLALLTLSTESQAGIFRCRRAAKCAPAASPSCQQGAIPQMQRWAPPATPQAPAPVAPVTAEDGSPRNLTYPVAYRTTSQPEQLQEIQSTGADPYGFVSWLNGVRAQYGLGAVSYDGNLSAWGAVNDQSQRAYGMGHHVMPARRQNAGAGQSPSVIFPMWLASPGHRAALLDPSITTVGISATPSGNAYGYYWTFNAN